MLPFLVFLIQCVCLVWSLNAELAVPSGKQSAEGRKLMNFEKLVVFSGIKMNSVHWNKFFSDKKKENRDSVQYKKIF